MDFGATKTFSQKTTKLPAKGMNCNSALIPSTNNIIQFPLDNSAIKKRQDMYDDQLIDKENRWNNDADCLIYSLEDLKPKTLQSFKEPFAKLYIMLITLSTKYNEFYEKKCNSEATSKCAKWKQYRLGDCIDVCAQEAERIVQCLENIPEKELLGNKPLMELEQQFGIWQPYISDNDSDDEDWKEETGPFSQSYETDEDEMQSDEDIEIIE